MRSVKDEVDKKPYEQLRDKVRVLVGNRVWRQGMAQIQFGSRVWDEVTSQVWVQVEDRIEGRAKDHA